MKRFSSKLFVFGLLLVLTTRLVADEDYYQKWFDISYIQNKILSFTLIDTSYDLPVLGVDPDGKEIHGKVVDWSIEYTVSVANPLPDTGVAIDISSVNTIGNPHGVAVTSVTPAPTHTSNTAEGVRYVWVASYPGQQFHITINGTQDLERIEWGWEGAVAPSKPTLVFNIYEDYNMPGTGGPGGPGIPGAGESGDLSGQVIYFKPGINLVSTPAPAIHYPGWDATGGTCSLLPEEGDAVPGHTSLQDVQRLLRPDVVSDVYSAEQPSGCTSCGGAAIGGDGVARSALQRYFKQQNLFWPTSTGRGSFTNFDYSLMFRDDGGQNVAIMFDPVLGGVVKFHQRFDVEEVGGGGNPPPGDPTPTISVPTEWFDPDPHNFYFESFRVLDDLGNPILDPVIEGETGTVYAEVVRRNGYKYKFRLINRFDSRVEEIHSPSGELTTIRYKSDFGEFTDEELQQSPTRVKQIKDVTGPDGRVATFSYHPTKMAGRWAVSEVEYDNGEKIQYDYGTDGFLSQVSRKRNPASNMVLIAEYGYSSTNDHAVIEQKHFNGKFFVTKQRLVTSDYRLAALSATDGIVDRTWTDDNEFGGLGDSSVAGALALVNQVGGELHGINDGSGQRKATFYRSNTGDALRILYENQLLEWTYGDSVKYATVIPIDPGDFEDGTFEDTGSPGEMYATMWHQGGQPGNSLYANKPESSRDKYGNIYYHEYDAGGNLSRTIYDYDVLNPTGYTDYEEWTFDSRNAIVMYRDRGGKIVLYVRDVDGRITAVVRGLVDDGNGGYHDPASVAIQTRYEYGANGLLLWSGESAFSAGDPSADYRTEYEYDPNYRVTKITKPAIQTAVGVLTRPVINFVWYYDELVSMTDENGHQTTFEYDDYGRLTRTNYPDTTTAEVYYDDPGKKIFRKSRTGSVSLSTRDSADRQAFRYGTYGNDSSTILDGQVQTIHPSQDQSTLQLVYNNGWDSSYGNYDNGTFRRTYTDYRGRERISISYPGGQAYRRLTTKYYNNRPFKKELTVSQFVDGVQNFHNTYTYHAYSAQNQLVRTIACRDYASYASNDQLLNLVRPTGLTPSIRITDSILDLSGNVVEEIAPDGIKTRMEYDQAGRPISIKQAYQTAIESVSLAEYDTLGRQFASVAPGGIRNETLYDPAGNAIETKVLPSGGGLSPQVTKFTYTIKGKPKQTIANDGSISEQFYSSCCGHTQGFRNALGNGLITNSDPAGRAVHQVQVGNFDTQWNSPLNPATADTYSESTTRYGADGRIQFTTRWKQDPGAIDVANPPIAGIDSVPAANGLTTQYVYDDQLNDGVGLDATGGMGIDRIHTGGVNAINITAAIAKLADTEANGGAELVPSGYDPLSATVVISPDEKIMSVSISNESGTTTLSGVMTGPAATAPNQLVDWTSTRTSLRATGFTGHTWVRESRTIYPDGTTTSSLSNGFGQQVGAIDQDGITSTQIYDVSGNLARTVDPLGNETNYVYDELGRNVSTTNPLQHTTSVTFDPAGRIATITDAKGGVTTNTYDGFGRLVEVEDRLLKSTYRFYDNMNRLTSIVDAENKATAYEYDALGRRIKRTLDDGSETSYAYDAAGRQYEVIKPSGIKIKSIYQPYSGELDKVEYYDAASTLSGTDDFTYDGFLRKTGSTSRYGVVRALTYTERGQIASDATTYGGQTYTVGYSYDDRGRLDEITYPSGRQAAYTFDDRGLLDTISWDGSQIEDRGYSDLGQLISVDRPYIDESRTYDDAGRLTAINNNNVGNATYTYDENGNKQSETWTANMSGWSFNTTNTGTYPDGYDAEDRLRNFKQPTKSVDLYLDRSDIGNITNYKLGSTNAYRSYSNIHELTTVDGTSQTFDADGNLTDAHTGIELDWDEGGMLEQTVVSSGDTAGIEGTNEYGYDAGWNRVWKKITRGGGVAEHIVFIYAGPNCIAEYDAGAAAASPSQEYVYADGIDSLVMIVRNSGAQQLTVTRNQQWSIAALADNSDGTVLERYTYDALGGRTILAADGSTIRTTSSYDNPYGYTSRRHDEESALMYFRARFYDSTTGEFVSQDPLEYVDGMSQYRGYFALNGMDPTGTDEISAVWNPKTEQFDLYWINIGICGGRYDPVLVGSVDNNSGFVQLTGGRWTTIDLVLDEGQGWNWTDWEHFSNDGSRTCPNNPATCPLSDFLNDKGYPSGLAAAFFIRKRQMDEADGCPTTPSAFDAIVNSCGHAEALANDLMLFYATMPLEMGQMCRTVSTISRCSRVSSGIAPSCGRSSRDLAFGFAGRLARFNSRGFAKGRVCSAVVCKRTGRVFYGVSRGKPMQQSTEICKFLSDRVSQSTSVCKWPMTNCAEFNAVNNAILSGSRFEDLTCHTVQIGNKFKNGAPVITTKPMCGQCQQVLKGLKCTSN